MADLVNDGSINLSGNWQTTGHTLISTNTGVTALTTGNLDSATFIPAASAIRGLMIRLGSRATGSPTNTMTITLRNSTTGTNAQSVTVNVSDLPVSASGTDSEGGWMYLKFSATHTPNGTDSYLVRATLSSTSTAVSLCTNGTANNWQRMTVLDTTATVAAADDMHVVGTFDGSASPATVTARTVTMDSTAATDYGSANTNSYVAALDVNMNGTLSYGTSASTNYVLRVSGFVKVYASGTLSIGTTGTPIPRTSTAVLELDCGANDQFRLQVMNLGTCNIQGLSRTSGKNVSQTLLTADMSAGATSATVADDTGWLNGDEVGIASTSRTATDAEILTLTADAGSSSFSHGASGAAHLGTTAQKAQAELVLLNRNVEIRSVSSTNQMTVRILPTAIVDADWARFRYCGAGNTTGTLIETTTGTVSFVHCIARDTVGNGWRISGTPTTGTITITDCSGYSIAPANNGCITFDDARTSSIVFGNSGTITMQRCMSIGDSSQTANFGFRFAAGFRGCTISHLYGSSSGNGVRFSGQVNYNSVAVTNLYMHSNAGSGISADGGAATGLRNLTIGGDLYVWRHNSTGVVIGSANNFCGNVQFTGTTVVFGNTTIGMDLRGHVCGSYFANLRFNSDTTFTQGTAIQLAADVLDCRIDRYTSAATGILTAGSTFLSTTTACRVFQVVVINANTAEATGVGFSYEFEANDRTSNSYFSLQSEDGDLTTTRTLTPFGNLTYETTTVDVSPSLKMTPTHATFKLESAGGSGRRRFGYLVGALSGEQPTINVMVRKDGSYTGNQPRLILKTNDALDITADTVLDTMSVGANTWETLSGQVPSTAPENGVYECVVDCDGTAGNVFVDTWSATGATGLDGTVRFWHDGLPALTVGAAGGGSSSTYAA